MGVGEIKKGEAIISSGKGFGGQRLYRFRLAFGAESTPKPVKSSANALFF